MRVRGVQEMFCLINYMSAVLWSGNWTAPFEANIIARRTSVFSIVDVDRARLGKSIYGFSRYLQVSFSKQVRESVIETHDMATSPSRRVEGRFCLALQMLTSAQAPSVSHNVHISAADALEFGTTVVKSDRYSGDFKAFSTTVYRRVLGS
jgi:hypothetical protein